MWKTLSAWLLAFANMARELEESRASIRRLESRLRDTEETVKLLALEQHHDRKIEAMEREKLLLQLRQELTRLKELPPRRKKK